MSGMSGRLSETERALVFFLAQAHLAPASEDVEGSMYQAGWWVGAYDVAAVMVGRVRVQHCVRTAWRLHRFRAHCEAARRG